MLSRYGEVFPEADTWEPETDPHREELKDLLRRRRQFIDQRVQELGRLDKGISATIAKSTRRHIAWLEKEIARLDKEYQAVLQDNATLTDRAALYRTVPGIGPLTRGNPGGPPSRTGPLGQQGFDLPGGTGALVPRQRQEARASRHQGRPGTGAESAVHVRMGGHPP